MIPSPAISARSACHSHIVASWGRAAIKTAPEIRNARAGNEEPRRDEDVPRIWRGAKSGGDAVDDRGEPREADTLPSTGSEKTTLSWGCHGKELVEVQRLTSFNPPVGR